jgi:uncharacterized protein (DUF952 family)
MLFCCVNWSDLAKAYKLDPNRTSATIDASKKPVFLYKIITEENWMTSLENKKLLSEKDDTDFIHLATNEQIPKIASKYFKDKNYIILKLEVKRLHGNLILEANPGGLNLYYHLYDGYIPINSIVGIIHEPDLEMYNIYSKHSSIETQ